MPGDEDAMMMRLFWEMENLVEEIVVLEKCGFFFKDGILLVAFFTQRLHGYA